MCTRGGLARKPSLASCARGSTASYPACCLSQPRAQGALRATSARSVDAALAHSTREGKRNANPATPRERRATGARRAKPRFGPGSAVTLYFVGHGFNAVSRRCQCNSFSGTASWNHVPVNNTHPPTHQHIRHGACGLSPALPVERHAAAHTPPSPSRTPRLCACPGQRATGSKTQMHKTYVAGLDGLRGLRSRRACTRRGQAPLSIRQIGHGDLCTDTSTGPGSSRQSGSSNTGGPREDRGGSPGVVGLGSVRLRK